MVVDVRAGVLALGVGKFRVCGFRKKGLLGVGFRI